MLNAIVFLTDTRQSLEAQFKPLTDRKLHEIAAYLNLVPAPEDDNQTDKENGKSVSQNDNDSITPSDSGGLFVISSIACR